MNWYFSWGEPLPGTGGEMDLLLMQQAEKKTRVIPSTLAEAHRVQEQIISDVRDAGFTDEAGFAIRLALDEALSNAVKHGNQLDVNKNVTVACKVDSKCVIIEIVDEGPGFDPEDVPDPTLEEYIERPHGRGLMLMRAYMTEVYYADNGRRVVLRKDRDCRLPRQA